MVWAPPLRSLRARAWARRRRKATPAPPLGVGAGAGGAAAAAVWPPLAWLGRRRQRCAARRDARPWGAGQRERRRRRAVAASEEGHSWARGRAQLRARDRLAWRRRRWRRPPLRRHCRRSPHAAVAVARRLPSQTCGRCPQAPIAPAPQPLPRKPCARAPSPPSLAPSPCRLPRLGPPVPARARAAAAFAAPAARRRT